MKILILGGSGMLGHRLWINLSRVYETWVTVREDGFRFPNWPEFDQGGASPSGVSPERVLSGVNALVYDQVARALAVVQPDLVINCIGLIKQARLAGDPLSTIQVNALLPHQLALICQTARIRMIHISTDCVFSGKQGNYMEDDPSDALDLYGRTKFLGEVAYPHTITLRTSFIGRELKSRLGLIEWFLAQKDAIRGYRRAIYTGFTADELSRIILHYVIEHPELSGVYHVSSQPITKYDLLLLARQAFHHLVTIEPDDDFVCDRSLNSLRFRQLTGYTPPTWQAMIEELALEDI